MLPADGIAFGEGMTDTLRSRALIDRLIGFDTTSRGSNLAIIEWIGGYLTEHGVEIRLTHDDQGAKANLYATLGPADRPGIMLSGHTDVVPVDGQPWDTDPWTVVERDGRLYGRGTCDMKSFVAVVLAYVPEFLERGLETPIHLAFSYDEEVGCIGVRRLIADLANLPVRPKACIVGEPTDMRVVAAHKGKRSYRCTVRGQEAHSSMTHIGVNAVEYAAEMVAKLKAMARRFRDEGPFDRDFTPPYTTVHTGTIHGGTALNIVPLACSFDFEWRYLPEHDPDSIMAELRAFADGLLPEMHRVTPDAGYVIEELTEIPGLATETDAEVNALARALSGGNAIDKVGFGSEAGLYQAAGIPTIVCGPGSIEQAHKPNEYVEVDQVRQCEALMDRLVERVCRRTA